MTPEEERDYQEALRRIKEAEENKSVELDLDGLSNLTRFPPELADLASLQSLQQSVTAFRSEIGQNNLAGLSTNLRQIQGSTTTDAQYQRALAQFRRRPDPPGQVLNWVCRDNVDYLDLVIVLK